MHCSAAGHLPYGITLIRSGCMSHEQHMEKHADKYPRASVREVCSKVAKELEKLKAS